MYQLDILKKLFQEELSKKSIDYLLDKKALLFDKDNLSFFDFLLKNYKTYNKFPTIGFLESFFEGEGGSIESKVFEAVLATEPDEAISLVQYIDMQSAFRLRSKLSETLEGSAINLVETPDSKIQSVMSELSLRLAELKSMGNAVNKESIGAIKGITDLVLHYKSYFAELDKAKSAATGFGFEQIDKTLGLTPADFVVLAGFTGDGKSTLAREISYRNVIAGKNVFFITTEMPHESLMDFFISLHSRHPKWGRNNPKLRARDITTNQLDAQQRAFLYKVAEDFENNEEYGDIKIVEPKGINYLVSDLHDEITTTHFLEYNIDLVVWDYLTNSKVVLNRTAKPEDYNQAIVDTKRLTTSLRIPAIICAQVNREGNKEFLKHGRYSLSALSTYNELERSATQVIFTGRTEEDRSLERFRIQHAKNRFGKLFEPFNLFLDPVSGSLITEGNTQMSSEDILDIVNSLDI